MVWYNSLVPSLRGHIVERSTLWGYGKSRLWRGCTASFGKTYPAKELERSPHKIRKLSSQTPTSVRWRVVHEFGEYVLHNYKQYVGRIIAKQVERRDSAL